MMKPAKSPPKRPATKPTYVHAVKAVNYWVIFDDMAQFFAQAHMPVVSKHLAAACAEIDRIWEEADYDNGQDFPC